MAFITDGIKISALPKVQTAKLDDAYLLSYVEEDANRNYQIPFINLKEKLEKDLIDEEFMPNSDHAQSGKGIAKMIEELELDRRFDEKADKDWVEQLKDELQAKIDDKASKKELADVEADLRDAEGRLGKLESGEGLDDDVTEFSPRGVKSSGIYKFVTNYIEDNTIKRYLKQFNHIAPDEEFEANVKGQYFILKSGVIPNNIILRSITLYPSTSEDVTGDDEPLYIQINNEVLSQESKSVKGTEKSVTWTFDNVLINTEEDLTFKWLLEDKENSGTAAIIVDYSNDGISCLVDNEYINYCIPLMEIEYADADEIDEYKLITKKFVLEAIETRVKEHLEQVTDQVKLLLTEYLTKAEADETYLRGTVVYPDELPPEEERRDDFNYFVVGDEDDEGWIIPDDPEEPEDDSDLYHEETIEDDESLPTIDNPDGYVCFVTEEKYCGDIKSIKIPVAKDYELGEVDCTLMRYNFSSGWSNLVLTRSAHTAKIIEGDELYNTLVIQYDIPLRINTVGTIIAPKINNEWAKAPLGVHYTYHITLKDGDFYTPVHTALKILNDSKPEDIYREEIVEDENELSSIQDEGYIGFYSLERFEGKVKSIQFPVDKSYNLESVISNLYYFDIAKDNKWQLYPSALSSHTAEIIEGDELSNVLVITYNTPFDLLYNENILFAPRINDDWIKAPVGINYKYKFTFGSDTFYTPVNTTFTLLKDVLPDYQDDIIEEPQEVTDVHTPDFKGGNISPADGAEAFVFYDSLDDLSSEDTLIPATYAKLNDFEYDENHPARIKDISFYAGLTGNVYVHLFKGSELVATTIDPTEIIIGNKITPNLQWWEYNSKNIWGIRPSNKGEKWTGEGQSYYLIATYEPLSYFVDENEVTPNNTLLLTIGQNMVDSVGDEYILAGCYIRKKPSGSLNYITVYRGPVLYVNLAYYASDMPNNDEETLANSVVATLNELITNPFNCNKLGIIPNNTLQVRLLMDNDLYLNDTPYPIITNLPDVDNVVINDITISNKNYTPEELSLTGYKIKRDEHKLTGISIYKLNKDLYFEPHWEFVEDRISIKLNDVITSPIDYNSLTTYSNKLYVDLTVSGTVSVSNANAINLITNIPTTHEVIINNVSFTNGSSQSGLDKVGLATNCISRSGYKLTDTNIAFNNGAVSITPSWVKLISGKFTVTPVNNTATTYNALATLMANKNTAVYYTPYSHVYVTIAGKQYYLNKILNPDYYGSSTSITTSGNTWTLPSGVELEDGAELTVTLVHYHYLQLFSSVNNTLNKQTAKLQLTGGGVPELTAVLPCLSGKLTSNNAMDNVQIISNPGNKVVAQFSNGSGPATVPFTAGSTSVSISMTPTVGVIGSPNIVNYETNEVNTTYKVKVAQA